MLTLLILGIFLSLYFFKYLPKQQNDYNRRAFLELGQIEKAVQSRNSAYLRALNFIQNSRVSSPLFRSFKDGTIAKADPMCERLLQKGVLFLSDDLSGSAFRLTYPLQDTAAVKKDSIHILSIRIDSVLNPIISTYKDIFDSYLLIARPDTATKNGDRIIFNSDNLSLDFKVSTDSLLNKRDGFSIRNVRDVTIEGNAYKLFIYPFQLGNQSVILAGLTTEGHYSGGYTDMPLELLIPASIIILLLLINFPILKVFILGIYERITDIDIRLIIGSYFVAAFAGFFLFSWLFMLRTEKVENKNDLEALSTQVQNSFIQELHLVTAQLKSWDNTYAAQLRNKDSLLYLLKSGARTNKNDSIRKKDSAALDKLYQPAFYPWSDYTFWIDSAGKWQATWSEKKYNNRPLLLRVDDRKYFKDFVNRKYLLLPTDSTPCPFTIQPTLSRLDGNYTVNINIASQADSARLVGMATQMISVTNTILPCGFNFSIIDDGGQVLYDSRQGRALLSNILKESDDPGSIEECTRFRSKRYFSSFGLKGQKVALFAAPMKMLPYTILTYCSLSDADSAQLHLIGLAAFFGACVLILLIISTIINEWTAKRPGILLTPGKHFDWLRPLPYKEKYYRRLISGMLSMLGIYILSWLIIKNMPRQLEFSLFFISLALPFYAALYYYVLREKQKQPEKNFLQLITTRPLFPVLLFLTLIILVIISFSTSDTRAAGWIPWISLVVQLLLLTVISYFISTYKNGVIPKTEFSGPLRSCPPPCETHGTSWLKYYSIAIVTGVVLISVIPACGFFWLLSWQESSMADNSTRVAMARAINNRRLSLNDRLSDYKSTLADADSHTTHHEIKFRRGIYLIPGDTILPAPETGHHTFLPLSTQYQDIHQFFFAGDSSVLASTDHPDSADDGTWSFFTIHKRMWLQYQSPTDWVDKGPLQIQANPDAGNSSLFLVSRQTGNTGPLFIFLYFGAQLLSVFLAYKVTMSLATRIFMIDLFEDLPCPPDEPAEKRIPEWLQNIRTQEKITPGQETILCNREINEKLYAQIWNPLSSMEKFVLYDLAKDGFTNYRTGSILWQLQKKNILVFYNGQLEPVTDSFREYVLNQYNDRGVVTCMKKSRQNGTWQSFKLPMTILFTAFGLFIFFTQGALYQKLGGLLTSLISMGAQISSLFDKPGRQPAPESTDPSEPAED